jgi:hypothetical protein
MRSAAILFAALLPLVAAPVALAAPVPDAGAVRQATAITGVVLDAAGGAVAGALVVARVASGAERQTVTDDAGAFIVVP